MNDRSVISEHVNFLDTRDGVDGELLELRLEFFVVSVGSLVHDLLLPAGSTFASDSDVGLLKTIVRNKKNDKIYNFLDISKNFDLLIAYDPHLELLKLVRVHFCVNLS